MVCPDPESLVTFARGTIAEGASAELHDHLDACSSCLHIVAELMRSTPGDAASSPYPDRYHVLDEHAHGGQARVLRGYDAIARREVAIKEPLPRSRGDGHARFLREARITAGLTHPGIVPVFDIGRRADGQPFYTMQFVRGRTFAAAVRACATLAGRLKLLSHFLELCQAVSFAHHRGVVHRDIKPQNVVIGEFGQTVLLDWGLAKVHGAVQPREVAIDDDEGDGEGDERGPPSATAIGTVVGTPAYMSPEQAAGRVDDVDERSDVFGLGAVLYELLTGVPPLDGDARAEVLGAARAARIVPVTERCPDAPGELTAIAHKALAVDPGDRYERAADLASDIQSFMTGGRVSSYAYSAWELVRRLIAGHRRAATAIAAALVALVVALVALAGAVRATDAARLRALRSGGDTLVESAQASLLEGDPLVARAKLRTALEVGDTLEARARWWQLTGRPLHFRLFIGGELHGLAASPRERLIAVSGGRPGIRLVDLDTRAVRVVLPEDGSPGDTIMSVSFAPDGRTLASGSIEGKARLLDVATSGWRTLAGAVGELWQIRYAPDGKSLYGVEYGGKLWRWQLAPAGAAPTLLSDAPAAGWDLAVSPDGARVALVTAEGEARLVEVATRREVRLPCRRNVGMGVAFSPDGAWIAVANGVDQVCLWPAASAGLVPPRILVGAAAFVAFSPGSDRLAGANREGQLLVWDLASGVLQRALREGDTVFARRPVWSADGREIAVIFLDGTVKLFAADALPARAAATPPGVRQGVSVSPDGLTIATANEDGTLRFYDAATGVETRVVTAHAGAVSSVAYAPDGTRLVTSGVDAAVRLWDARTGRPQKTLAGHSTYAIDARFSADGRLVASPSMEKVVRVWDTETGGLVATLPDCCAVAFAAHGPELAVATADGKLAIWDARAGARLDEVELPGGGLFAPAFMDGDARVAVGTYDDKVLVWDRRARTSRSVAVGGPQAELELDGARGRVAVLPQGGPLAVLDLASERRTQLGAEGTAHARFTPDGTSLVTGSAAGTLQVWDLATGRPRWRGPRVEAGRAGGFGAAAARDGLLADEAAAVGCVATFDAAVEVYARGAAGPSARVGLEGVRALIAEGDGCIALTPRALVRVGPDGGLTELVAGATAVAAMDGGFLVAAGDRIVELDPRGTVRRERRATHGISAVAALGSAGLALGYSHGGIELWRGESTLTRVRELRDTRQIDVVKLVVGPPGTVAAAFADGSIGLWSTGSGALLHATWLQGAATMLRMSGTRLVAVTDAGSAGAWDLATFTAPYCEVLREVWRDVPVVWEGGTPVRRAIPRGHACAGP